MKNKELKKKVVSNGTYKKYTDIRKNVAHIGGDVRPFVEGIDENTGEVFPTINEIYKYSISDTDIKECEHLRVNRIRQTSKVQDHLDFLFRQKNNILYFCTFTFNDETLAKTNFRTRKRKIVSFLGKCLDFVINVDYGSQNEREHYHAIVSLPTDVCIYKENGFDKCTLFDDYNYGFYSMKLISRNERDLKKIAKYETKLTLHSIKVEQSYISVKKGSYYQFFKDFREKGLKYHVLSYKVGLHLDMILDNDPVYGKLRDAFGLYFDVVEGGLEDESC